MASQVGGSEYLPLEELKRNYSDYLWTKRDELDEQIVARRYYHGSQWTDDQLRKLKSRNQPSMTFNRVARKIDAVVGMLERMKQDPKAFPRTPIHEQGAELATAALRYALDQQDWRTKRADVAHNGAIEGISGVELGLEPGDTGTEGDFDVSIEVVDPDDFFYDPRSFRLDFSDARYMGVAKWVTLDAAIDMFPDKKDDLEASVQFGTDLETWSDKQVKWFSGERDRPRVRLVDHWYKMPGDKWCYAVHTGSVILKEGQSWLQDEKRRDICKYVMVSGNVDQDGDRYGFPRNLKSAQDGINAKQSKMMHLLASRRLMLRQGATDNIEKIRREWAKPDGVLLLPPKNAPISDDIKADDFGFDFSGWGKLLELNLNEIENFGPNPALIGQGIENKSGRAIQLLQQAGIAELGPFIIGYRGWTVRVYRAVWNALRQYWKAERWVRVTDNEGLQKFIQLNSVGVDPNTGAPAIVNSLGALDVDIILDEGPDQVTMMADSYDTLTALAQAGAQVPPRVLIELAPLTYSVKKKITDLMDQQAQQPNPAVQMKQAELQMRQTEVQAGIASDQAKAQADRDKAQADFTLKQQQAQAELAMMAAKAEQDAQIKAAELALEREKAAAEIQLERDKLYAQLALEREKEANKLGMEELPEAPEPPEPEKPDEHMQKMEHIAAMLHKTIAAVTAPRRVKLLRDEKTGRAIGSVSTVELPAEADMPAGADPAEMADNLHRAVMADQHATMMRDEQGRPAESMTTPQI